MEKDLGKELGKVFETYEQTWRERRKGAEEATDNSIRRLKNGEEIIFVYPYAAPEVVDRIIEESGAIGQFSLPFILDGVTDPMLHVRQKWNE